MEFQNLKLEKGIIDRRVLLEAEGIVLKSM
jgi:hypothetical protein